MSLLLLHTAGDILRWAMVALGIGADPTISPLGSWPIYAGKQPDHPDNVLTVYTTQPRLDGRDMATGEVFLHYGFQVRIRGSSDPVAGAKGEAVKTSLEQSLYDKQVRIGSNVYLVHSASTSGLNFIGEDSPNSKRQVYTLNGIVSLRRIS